MQGGGKYNEHSRPQGSTSDYCVAQGFLGRAVEAIPVSALRERRPITIADYGASQGKNSIAIVNAALDCLIALLQPQQRGEGEDDSGGAREPAALDVVVYHEDLPSNDFASLLAVLQRHSESYLQRADVHARAECVPRSFFEPCLEAGSVSFAFASSAFHWLSGVPSPLEGSVWVHSSRVPEEVQRQWADWARKDWANLLRLRSAELHQGGVLLLNNPGRAEDERPILLIGDVMRDACEGEEPERFTVPFYRRTLAEHLDEAALSAAGLEVVFAEARAVPSSLWAEFTANGGDVKRVLDAFLGHIEAVSHAACCSWLSATHSSPQALTAAAAAYFGRLRKRVERLIEEDTNGRLSEQSVVRQLANDHHTMFLALRKR